jgi:hypothetical protein
MSPPNQEINNTKVEGLRVLLAGSGTIEIQHSILTSLIDLGYEVFWSWDEHLSDVFDQPIDLVFHLNMLHLGLDYINRLRENLDRKNPEAIIVDIPLAHPILSYIRLGIESVDEFNYFLKSQKIIQWSMCRTTLKEWEEFGFINGIYAPLGIGEYVYVTNDYKHPLRDWLNDTSKLVKYNYGSNQNDPDYGSQSLLIKDMIVYAGAPTSIWEDQTAIPSIKGIEYLQENFLPDSKEVFKKIYNMEIEPNNRTAFIQSHYLWSASVQSQRRRKMVQAVSKRFKSQTSIWGDGWGKYINNFYPHSQTPRFFYHQALCCLDFGSLQFDTPLFPRTCEIMKKDGLLISGVCDDENILPKENQFKTIDQMLDIIESVLDPVERQKKLEKQTSFNSMVNFTKTLSDIITKAYKSI